jgi:hypothetical protein
VTSKKKYIHAYRRLLVDENIGGQPDQAGKITE